ncbi:DUF6497 family protein [Rhodovulum sulfidophilum]|uniref:DUF6497 family protein n=1 Tax=Rhodovulum sulfidophilum TaxID=35806 RepID=UPI00138A0AA3|nr:DUF6497 family protein [Rhodovulum sulfidophilum]NDK33566.1 acetolactate synthase [Rhodovulum sulfidophilum]
MILRAVLLAGAALVLGASGEVIDVPSGQSVTHLDTITGEPGPAGLTVRFRFLAPDIAQDEGSMPATLAQGDMDYLCAEFALPRLAGTGPEPAQVIITLMDRPVPFGQSDPEATQFFEAYRPEAGRCIWEGF